MSETKPTVGALRAAKEILESILVFTSKPASSAQIEEAVGGAAEIIDRETGSPKVEELLKCGRAALEHISLYRTGIQTGSHCDMGNAVPERLVEAIREVEAALKGEA